jgi:thioesterase domain-containing protein
MSFQSAKDLPAQLRAQKGYLASGLTKGWCCVQSGKVVYFRARQRGACTYFDDSREGPLAHGLCWAPYCNDLQVVDVPGDHFSLLRQDEKDMSIIVDTLQMVLSAFGWHTTVKRDQKIYNKMNDVSFTFDEVFVQVQF